MINKIIEQIIEKLEKLHVEDPRKWSFYKELTNVLVNDENETIRYLYSLKDKKIIDRLSSIFPEVSYKLQSQEFIKATEHLEKENPDLIIGNMVNASKDFLYSYEAIKKFYVVSEFNQEVEISIGPEEDFYKVVRVDPDGGWVTNMPRGNIVEIKWIYGKDKVARVNNNNGKYIKGYPTRNLKYMIIIYCQESETFPAPKNAVIYNSDGTFFRQLECPQLISERALKCKEILGTRFDDVRLWTNPLGTVYTAIKIGYNQYNYEERIYDVDTGKWGEVIMDGIY